MYMEVSKSLRMVRCLAEGVDPTTGEVLSPDSPCQHPDVVRSRFAAAAALEKSEQRQSRARSLPENAGRPWNPEEDKRLCECYAGGKTIRELSRQHGRTQGAIQSRLIKLGQLPPYLP